MKFNKKFIVFPMMFILCGVNCQRNNVRANVNLSNEPEIAVEDSKSPYTIYPTPQAVTYTNETFTFKKHLKVVIEDGIDIYTKNKFYDVLSLKDVKGHLEGNYDCEISMGIYGSQKSVDNSLNHLDLSYINEKFDAYYLSISSHKITILGKDSDACFFALSTLESIFKQTNMTISTLTIQDYSDSQFRGFIEGYYGIPWTSDERIELMRFGSQFKSNIYIYAPKDDAYHSSNWRSLYTENDLKILKQQIQAGNETKTRFAWAIHPFMNNPITTSTYNAGLSAIIQKFNQLYDAGVRQFMISADDISLGIYRPDFNSDAEFYDALNNMSIEEGSLQGRLLNDVAKWNKEKGDCYDLVFVPTPYNTSTETTYINMDLYFENLMNGLDDSINIMWTGNRVCSSVANGDFDVFERLTNGRKAFMWMNWPVTDYAQSHLLMSKGEVFNKTYSEDEEIEFSGIVVNPMQQAEPSKLSIFAVCDYTWNIRKFDQDKSYADSMKYVESGTTESFYEIVQHLANASRFEDQYFEESSEFSKLVNNLKNAIKNNANITRRIEAICDYLDALVSHCDNYVTNATNKELLKSIKPWVLALKDTALAINGYLDLYNNLDKYDTNTLRTKLSEVEEIVEQANNHYAPILNTVTQNISLIKVDVAIAVLTPFLKSVQHAVTDEVKLSLGDDTGIIYEGFQGIYEGNIENIADGDETTFCWFNGQPSENAYVRVDLGEVQEIKDVRIVQGNADNRDYMNGVVEYSLDAKNWVEIGNINNQVAVFDLTESPINARFLRLRNVNTYNWVAIKEVAVNVMPKRNYKIQTTNFGTISEGELYNLLDGNDDTYCWFTKPSTDAHLDIIFDEVQNISTLRIYNGSLTQGDYMDAVVEYSLDGINYIELGKLDNGITYFDLVDNAIQAKYIRLKDLGTAHWIALREISINVDLPDNYKKVDYEGFTFVENGTNSLQNMVDEDLATYTWFDWHYNSSAYIEIDFKTIKTINNIYLYSGCDEHISDYFYDNSVRILYSEDGINYTEIGIYGGKEIDIILDNEISARYLKLIPVNEEDSSFGVTIREFGINK